jgi:hypothetical protein
MMPALRIERMREIPRPVSLGLALGAALIVSAVAIRGDTPIGEAAPPSGHAAAWTEAKWPFLLDQWGTGRAFRCAAAACGAEMTIYLRPKIGFCNCTTGVSDDAELDRVGDIDLLGQRFAPLGDGRPITIAWMNGRSRSYVVEMPQPRTVLALAFNDKCDVVVATVVGERELPAAAERLAVAFLNSRPVLRWLEASLGL